MKTKLSRLFLAAGTILVCTGSATASTSFNFTALGINPSSSSTIPSQTLGGITVNEIAVWANVNSSGSTVTGTGPKFVASGTGQTNQPWIAEYSGDGLGVCSVAEQPGCSTSPPVHQIDNLNGTEFVLFGFNAAVSLNEVQVQSFGNPTGSGNDYIDMSYAILSASQEASLVAGTLVFSSVNFTTATTGSNSSAFDYNLTGTGQYVLIGTAVTANYGGNTGDSPDAFKIQDLTVSASPEPASFILIGSGLLAVVLSRRLLITRRSAKVG